MPTATTQAIYDGNPIDGAELAHKFAVGYGISELPERDIDYLNKKLCDLHSERDRLLELSGDELDGAAGLDQDYVLAENRRIRDESHVARRRYNEAIRMFTDWQPVTDIGLEVKAYAIEQIEFARDYDAPKDVFQFPLPPADPNEWLRHRLGQNQSSIERVEHQIAEEQLRVEKAARRRADIAADLRKLAGTELFEVPSTPRDHTP